MFLKYSLEKNKMGGASSSINIPFPTSIPAPRCSSEAKSKTIDTKIYFINASYLERSLDEYSNVISINSNYQIDKSETQDIPNQKGRLYLLRGDDIKDVIEKLKGTYSSKQQFFTKSKSIYSMTIPCNIPKSQIEKFQEKIVVLGHNAPSLNKLYEILITDNYNKSGKSDLIYNYKKVDIYALGLVFYEIICKTKNNEKDWIFHDIIEEIVAKNPFNIAMYRLLPSIKNYYKGTYVKPKTFKKIKEILTEIVFIEDVSTKSSINTISIIELLFFLTYKMTEYNIYNRINIDIVYNYLTYLKQFTNSSSSIAPNTTRPSISEVYESLKKGTTNDESNITLCLQSEKYGNSPSSVPCNLEIQIRIIHIINALSKYKTDPSKCGSFNCVIEFQNYILRIGNKRIDEELKASKRLADLDHTNIGYVCDYGRGYVKEWQPERLETHNIDSLLLILELNSIYPSKEKKNNTELIKLIGDTIGKKFQYSIMPKYNNELNPEELQINTPSELINFLLQLTDGVKYLHDKNIIHRDLKPENIMVDQDLAPIIIDFGLMDNPANDLTNNQIVMRGTGDYILTNDYIQLWNIIQYEQKSHYWQVRSLWSTKTTLFLKQILQDPTHLYNYLII